jgi:hypothetical protein
MGPGSPLGDIYTEPPCPTCIFWRPAVNAYLGGPPCPQGRTYYNGVTMCHAPEQEHDFSCHREAKR